MSYDDRAEGIITKGVGGVYTVRCEDGTERLCQIRGNIRLSGKTPLVGDLVVTCESGDPDLPFVLEKILPRKNFLIRPPLANLDNLLLFFSCTDPVPDLKLLDKMLIIAMKLDIKPVIVFSKKDRDPSLCVELRDIYIKAGFDAYCLGADDDVPIELIGFLGSGVTGLAGPSGVGKSTFCNRVLGESTVKVGGVSERLKRGKHTTRHTELFEYEGGYVTDTPGFTSLDLFEVGVLYSEVIRGYPEMMRAASGCRFKDCRHIAERECNVRDNPDIDKGRYIRYKEFYEYLYMRRPNCSGGYK